MKKRTLYFTMVRHPVNGWTRAGKPYNERKDASGWLPFVRGAWRGLPVKIAQCTVRFIDGKLCEKSRAVLDKKFNLSTD